jgi:PhoH-like ATPase
MSSKACTKLFVLDTNVLMHDPAALFRFHEHDLFIPMVVLEELDHAKKGLSDIARNARQTSRFLDELIRNIDLAEIREGVPISRLEFAPEAGALTMGRLFFQTEKLSSELPKDMPGDLPDNSILANALALVRQFPDRDVVLVSKDINLRIKASVLGLVAEDYQNDQVLDDVNHLYSGAQELPDDFWETHGQKMESWKDPVGRTFYRVTGPLVKTWHINQFLFMEDGSEFEAIVRSRGETGAVLELALDFRHPQHAVWGIQARNREQNFALNMLMDPEIDFVTLLGTAGTGKTLLTLATGLMLTLEQKHYREIIMTRETVPIGEDIGFLPGTEEEKMSPWMGALHDNLELLGGQDSSAHTQWERSATHQVLMSKISVRSLNFMRGRTFQSRFIILDEAQNLTSKQTKTLITRAGPGTKIVCLGDIAQIDTPYLTGTTSGLTYAVDRFKNWPHAGHISMRRGERSRLADFAADAL